MSISSSLSAGVAGLNANASKLASISDNIANASTYGYRRVETNFHSMVSAGGGNGYAAGGVQSNTQRLISEGGTLVASSNATDLAIRGRGFLPVTTSANSESSEMLLTTSGSFRPDEHGYLRSDSGLILMGWPADADGIVPNYPRDSSNGLEPVRINTSQLDGQPTTAVTMGVNLPATGTIAGAAGDSHELTISYYDNLGLTQNLSVEFVPAVPATGASNTWQMIVRDNAAGNAIVGDYQLSFDNTTASGGTLSGVTTTAGGAYDPVTGSISVAALRGDIDITIGALGDALGMTQLSDSFLPLHLDKNGSPASSMIGVEVDPDGRVNALFDNGKYRTIYQVPLVDMPNPNGLTSLDQQTYRPSSTSGTFMLWNAGSGPTGEIIGYAREESATDVARELTDLIQTQRAYSTNAKVIQTVDEMLQETTNIKR